MTMMQIIFFLVVVLIGAAVLVFFTHKHQMPSLNPTISELCDAANRLYGDYPMDPRGQVEWALKALGDEPGMPERVNDVVRRRIAIALSQVPYLGEPFNRNQIVFALQRARIRLDQFADELHEQRDYNAEFPAEDAARINEAILIVSASSDDLYAGKRINDAFAQSLWAQQKMFRQDALEDVCAAIVNGQIGEPQ